ncbi:hypothetical protein BC938DRAFT_474601 [Jimgerdemannia flammicorona]|uniref:Uncharacterized protein n=1 Tax=Jimgerdemannia flammicorona TaxID=994334 RepID=A0A433Q244_9FUNG|nr:hypothetical protein BC938DRAFT_474601 [Jimgerdemannia flammicorona]
MVCAWRRVFGGCRKDLEQADWVDPAAFYLDTLYPCPGYLDCETPHHRNRHPHHRWRPQHCGRGA